MFHGPPAMTFHSHFTQPSSPIEHTVLQTWSSRPTPHSPPAMIFQLHSTYYHPGAVHQPRSNSPTFYTVLHPSFSRKTLHTVLLPKFTVFTPKLVLQSQISSPNTHLLLHTHTTHDPPTKVPQPHSTHYYRYGPPDQLTQDSTALQSYCPTSHPLL